MRINKVIKEYEKVGSVDYKKHNDSLAVVRRFKSENVKSLELMHAILDLLHELEKNDDLPEESVAFEAIMYCKGKFRDGKLIHAEQMPGTSFILRVYDERYKNIISEKTYFSTYGTVSPYNV